MNKQDVIRIAEWQPASDTFINPSEDFYEIGHLFDLVDTAPHWSQIVLEDYTALDILICLADVLEIEVCDFNTYDDLFNAICDKMESASDSNKAKYIFWLENHYLKEDCRDFVFKEISNQSKRISYKEAKELAFKVYEEVLEQLEAYYNS